MMVHGGAGMGIGLLLWSLVSLALLVTLILVIIWLCRLLFSRGSGRDEAENELRRRYAAGDIDDEQYRRHRDILRER